jgi:DNA primase
MERKESEIIKEKLDIVEFIRSYTNLSPAGRNFKGLCPFHQEKTPSFMVSPDKRFFHCFGCGEGGDIIAFVMKYEHVEFPEALRMLAERAGIPMRVLSPTQEREFGVLYDLHTAAAEFFVAELEKNVSVKKYLTDRKLSEETIREFALGYNPPGDKLTLYLMQKRFDIRDIHRAGLVQKIKGLNRDRFENRIIFPLYNSFGKIVGFAGRVIPDPEHPNDEIPKYVNSPETSIYNKSKILYGFHRAKTKISESRSVFLVEGYMDFLMSWQSGVQNAVAISGTALTEGHLERLRRFADAVLLSFDNDAAGLRALERSIDMFHAYDFHVKAVDLGEYKDPAEACERDSKFLLETIEKAKPAFEYIFKKYFPDGADTEIDIPTKKRFIDYLIRKIKRVRSTVEQGIWIKRLGRLSGTSESVLLEMLDRIEDVKEKKVAEKAEEKVLTREQLLEKRLLMFGFAKPEFMSTIRENIELFSKSARQFIEVPNEEQAEFFRLRASYELQGKSEKEMEDEFQEILSYLEIDDLLSKQTLAKKKMSRAEEEGNEENLLKSIHEFRTLSQKIHDIKTKRRGTKNKNE